MSNAHNRRVGRFFIVISFIVILLHYYIGARLLPFLPLSASEFFLCIAALIFSAVAIPTSMLARFVIQQQKFADAIAWIGLTAMGLFSSLLVLTLLRDILFALSYWFISSLDMSVFLKQSAEAVIVLALLATLIGFINVRRVPAIVQVDIPLKNLPIEFHHFLIAQISDIHIGPTIKGKYLQAIVDEVNKLQPHIITITGDLVDGSVQQLGEQVLPLKNLRSQYGSYFVTGNHEYYSGALEWNAFVKKLGINVLINQHDIITHDGEQIVIAGVTDYSAEQIIAEHKSDPVAALRGAENLQVPKILLAHQPRSADAAEKVGFDVQLSGHTHGGQFWPWNFFVPLQQPFVAGLHKVNNMWVYINRGTGYWGPPKRLGGRSEITLIRLVRA